MLFSFSNSDAQTFTFYFFLHTVLGTGGRAAQRAACEQPPGPARRPPPGPWPPEPALHHRRFSSRGEIPPRAMSTPAVCPGEDTGGKCPAGLGLPFLSLPRKRDGLVLISVTSLYSTENKDLCKSRFSCKHIQCYKYSHPMFPVTCALGNGLGNRFSPSCTWSS